MSDRDTATLKKPGEQEQPGHSLIHTCPRHPWVGQKCVPGCKAYCGYEISPLEPDHINPPLGDCCAVCEAMFEAQRP